MRCGEGELALALADERSDVVAIANRGALALYESFGFETVGTTRVTIGSSEVGEELMMVRYPK